MYLLLLARGYPQPQYPLNGIFEFDQAKALTAAGHKVVFAGVDLRSLRRWRKWGYEQFESDGVSVRIINIPVGAVSRPLLDGIGKRAIKRLYRHIEAEFGRPDIVHAHFLDEAVIAADLCEREKLPLVITEHSSSINCLDASETDIERAKRAYSSADKIIAVSAGLKNMIKLYTDLDALVIPNIADLDTFQYSPLRRDSEAVEEYRFAATGNLIQLKAFDLLIDAFSDVIKTYPNTSVCLFGEGPMHKALAAQMKSQGLETKINLMGRQTREELAKAYAEVDAFVLPSRSETFGVAYIEAMASGLPVIATKCGGPEDFVTPETGILIPVDDRQALANAMIYMIAHRADYDGENISAYARERFSPQQIAAQLTGIYKDVLNSTKPGER